MTDTIAGRAKGFLLNPVETFRRSGTDAPASVFTYFGALLLVNAILSALVAAAMGFGSAMTLAGLPDGAVAPVLVFFLVLAGGFILTLIAAAWVHLWVYLLGGRRGIMRTITAVFCAGTPGLLLGWIPLIGLIFLLWSLVLLVPGIRELQELTTGKAIIAIAISGIIPLAIIVLSVSYFTVTTPATAPVMIISPE
ncbi:MAG: YIP1 family protein [Methanoregula sp.]|nr:YIP1 family protein [Methanoregula sp.]